MLASVAVFASPPTSEIKLVFSIPRYLPTPNFAPSWLKGSFKRRSGQRSVPCLSSPGSTVPRPPDIPRAVRSEIPGRPERAATTLATQLAVAWARCGARVAALDIDPQGSFSTWVDLRRARLGAKAIGFDFAALPGWRAAQWVDDRVGSADLVVIDAPPHAETEARIAVRVARLVVVPVQPSPLDLWATAETLKMAQDERRRSLVVLNRVPPRSRLTEDIAADLASAGTPIAATRIGNRVALAQAMALGLGVIENARMTPAAAEISALAEEIRGALSG